jgi:hypothetical protein
MSDVYINGAIVGSDNQQVNKIDLLATAGISSTTNSLAHLLGRLNYRAFNRSRFIGPALVPNGEIHVMDRISAGAGPYSITSGNNTWGAWVQVLGSADTPIFVGSLFFNIKRFCITNTASTADLILQSVTAADAAGIPAMIALDYYSEGFYKASSATADTNLMEMTSPIIPVGTKIWTRLWAKGANNITASGYMEIEEFIK